MEKKRDKKNARSQQGRVALVWLSIQRSATRVLEPLQRFLVRCGEVLVLVLYFLLAPLASSAVFLGKGLAWVLQQPGRAYQAWEDWLERQRRAAEEAAKAAKAKAAAEDKERFDRLRAEQAVAAAEAKAAKAAKASKKHGTKHQPAAGPQPVQRKPLRQADHPGAAEERAVPVPSPDADVSKSPAPAAREDGGGRVLDQDPSPPAAPSNSSTRAPGRHSKEVLRVAITAVEEEEEEEGLEGEQGSVEAGAAEAEGSSSAAGHATSPDKSMPEQQQQRSVGGDSVEGADRSMLKGRQQQAAEEAPSQLQELEPSSGEEATGDPRGKGGDAGSQGQAAAKQARRKQRAAQAVGLGSGPGPSPEQQSTQSGSEGAPAEAAMLAVSASVQLGRGKQRGHQAPAEAWLDSPKHVGRQKEVAAARQAQRMQQAAEAGGEDRDGKTAAQQEQRKQKAADVDPEHIGERRGQKQVAGKLAELHPQPQPGRRKQQYEQAKLREPAEAPLQQEGQSKGEHRTLEQKGQAQQRGQQRAPQGPRVSAQRLPDPPAPHSALTAASAACGVDAPSLASGATPEEWHASSGPMPPLQQLPPLPPPSPQQGQEQLLHGDGSAVPSPLLVGAAPRPPLHATPERPATGGQRGHYRPLMGQQQQQQQQQQHKQPQPNGLLQHPPPEELSSYPQPGWQPPQHPGPADLPDYAHPGWHPPGGMPPQAPGPGAFHGYSHPDRQPPGSMPPQPRPAMYGPKGPTGYPAAVPAALEAVVEFQAGHASDFGSAGLSAPYEDEEADLQEQLDFAGNLRRLSGQPDALPLQQQQQQGAWAPKRGSPPPAWEHGGAQEQPQPEGWGQALSVASEPERLPISGLSNEAGEYNCFLNAIVQCLWRCTDFRQQVLSWPSFLIDYNAVLHAVHSLFSQLDREDQAQLLQANGHGAAVQAGGRSGQSVVNPNQLREALSTLPGQLFREGEMNDAGEVLQAIYDQILTGVAAGRKMGLDLGVDLEGSLGLSVRECVRCEGCGLTTHRNSYTQFFYNAQATGLRDMLRVSNGRIKGLGSLLHAVEQQTLKSCDTDHGGCNRRLPVEHTLERTPRVFTLQLSWGSHGEEGSSIQSTLAAVSEEIDLHTVYRGLEPGQHVYRLRSLVCYYGAHYFAYVMLPEHQAWARIDDTRVSWEGSWEDVKRKCVLGRSQPSMLFFEKVGQ